MVASAESWSAVMVLPLEPDWMTMSYNNDETRPKGGVGPIFPNSSFLAGGAPEVSGSSKTSHEDHASLMNATAEAESERMMFALEQSESRVRELEAENQRQRNQIIALSSVVRATSGMPVEVEASSMDGNEAVELAIGSLKKQMELMEEEKDICWKRIEKLKESVAVAEEEKDTMRVQIAYLKEQQTERACRREKLERLEESLHKAKKEKKAMKEEMQLLRKECKIQERELHLKSKLIRPMADTGRTKELYNLVDKISALITSVQTQANKKDDLDDLGSSRSGSPLLPEYSDDDSSSRGVGPTEPADGTADELVLQWRTLLWFLGLRREFPVYNTRLPRQRSRFQLLTRSWRE